MTQNDIVKLLWAEYAAEKDRGERLQDGPHKYASLVLLNIIDKIKRQKEYA